MFKREQMDDDGIILTGAESFNPLKYAIKKGPIEYVKQLFDNNKYTVDQLNCCFKYALMRRSKTILRLLILHGGNINYSSYGPKQISRFLVLDIMKKRTFLVEREDHDHAEILNGDQVVTDLKLAVEFGLNDDNWRTLFNEWLSYDVDRQIDGITEFIKFMNDHNILHFICKSPFKLLERRDAQHDDTKCDISLDKISAVIECCDLTKRYLKGNTPLVYEITHHTHRMIREMRGYMDGEKLREYISEFPIYVTKMLECCVNQDFDQAIKFLEGCKLAHIVTKSAGYNKFLLTYFKDPQCYGSRIPADIVGEIYKFLIN